MRRQNLIGVLEAICRRFANIEFSVYEVLLFFTVICFFFQRAFGISPQSLTPFTPISDTWHLQADVRKRQSESSTEVPASLSLNRAIANPGVARSVHQVWWVNVGWKGPEFGNQFLEKMRQLFWARPLFIEIKCLLERFFSDQNASEDCFFG